MIVCHARPQYSLRIMLLVMTLAGLIMPAIADRYLYQKSVDSLTRAVLEMDTPRRTWSYAEEQAFKAVLAAYEAEQAQLLSGAATEEKEEPPVANAHGSP